jgi:hypothetical protein
MLHRAFVLRVIVTCSPFIAAGNGPTRQRSRAGGHKGNRVFFLVADARIPWHAVEVEIDIEIELVVDDTLDPEEQQQKIEYWSRLRDRDIAELEK